MYERGTEPDPRFSLANERTFLAWIRTALALLAAGVALEALQLPVQPVIRLVVALLLILLALLACGHAWVGWAQTERALREGRALPGLSTGPALALGLGAAIALVAVGLLLA